MPRGARRLPERCVELIAGSDVLIHAGDFVAGEVLDDLSAIGPPVRAVHGNVDESGLWRVLPAELTLDLGGHRMIVVHDAGPRRGRLPRLRRRHPDAEAVIFGHSHLPALEESEGFQIFNPGSPTERRRTPSHSMGLIDVTPQALTFEHVEL